MKTQLLKNEVISISSGDSHVVIENANVYKVGEDIHIDGDLIHAISVKTPHSVSCYVFEQQLPQDVHEKLTNQVVELKDYLVSKIEKGYISGDEILEVAAQKHPYFRHREDYAAPLMTSALILCIRAILWFFTITMFKFNPSTTQSYMKEGIYDTGKREHFSTVMPAKYYAAIKRYRHVNDIVKNIIN